MIADAGNDRVRVVAVTTGTFYGQAMTAGDIYSVAGNGTQGYSGDGSAATGAELDQPFGVGVDAAGNLLVTDLNDGRVREITSWNRAAAVPRRPWPASPAADAAVRGR